MADANSTSNEPKGKDAKKTVSVTEPEETKTTESAQFLASSSSNPEQSTEHIKAAVRLWRMSTIRLSPTPVVEEEKQPMRRKVLEKKPDIPVDFYYNIDEIRAGPKKSHDDLPNNFLVLVHSFGYSCRKRNNLHALSNNRIIFAAGCYLQIIKLGETKDSDYIYEYLRTVGGGSIGAITVHPSGKFFAVGEKGINPDLCVYDSADYRLYRIMRKGTQREYTSLCFDDTGELLASQGGDPDHMLTIWNWRQETILLRCKAFSQEVNHVSFNKELHGKLTTAGSGHVKFWNMARTFTGLKLQGQVGRFGRAPISEIEGLLEFPDGKVLTGSDWGNLLLWEEQLIKVQITRKGGRPCHNGQVMMMMMVEGEIITAGMDGFVRSWNFEIIDMLEGGEESALVEVEPMNEVLVGPGAQVYYLTQSYKAPKAPQPEVEGQASELTLSAKTIKSSMETAFTDDDLERSTWYCQDGAGGIWMADLSFRLTALPPKRLLSFHAGAIASCAVSPNTDLVMTLGEDGTLRLYDIVRRRLMAVKGFKGLKGSCLVWIPGRVDKNLATVMAGFSDGGIRRVGIDGNHPSLFGLDRMDCSLKLMQVLKPHLATVTDLAYNIDTGLSGCVSSLATCSEDRTIFYFNIFNEDSYSPLCFVPLQYVPRRLTWSTETDTCSYLLVTCDGSIVIETILPKALNTEDTLEASAVQMRAMKVLSIKSEFLHEKELAVEREQEEKREKERQENNKQLLEKGLETKSQQDLRVEQENALAAADKKAREEQEEPWVPYIPAVPSPVLQTIYWEGGSKFWLTMGDYDAGYFYECKFSTHFQSHSKEEPVTPVDTKPVRAVLVDGGTDDVVTAICFTLDGSGAILGTKDGCVRLLILETDYDLSTQKKYWNLGAHDCSTGSILGLKLSHSENFLITVGHDGNFFVFFIAPDDQMMTSRRAYLPAGNSVSDALQVEDLAPDAYTIEQHKQKSDHDEMLRMAEKRKQEKRVEIAALRAKFNRLVTANNGLPVPHRLAKNEFVMDSSLAEEAQRNKETKLNQLKREMAWNSAKVELGYRKLYDYFRKNVHTDFYCLHAMSTCHVIYSFRLEVNMPRTDCKAATRGHVRDDLEKEEESARPEDEDDAELARLIETSPLAGMDDPGCLSMRTAYLLKKVHEKRIERAKRKLAWKRFLATKPGEDVEDPRDLQAIEYAKSTIGDRPLKSDLDYTVPDHYRLTMADGEVRLRNCYGKLQRLQMDFNNKLSELREEKLKTIKEIRQIIARLEDIHDKIDPMFYCVIPQCPSMSADEQPGGEFQMDADLENSLKSQVKERRKSRIEKMRKESQRESEFSKSRRRSSAFIARENYSRRITVVQSLHTPLGGEHGGSVGGSPSRSSVILGAIMDEGASVSSAAVSSRVTPTRQPSTLMEEIFQSPLQQELKDIEQITLRYEQSKLLQKIEEKTQLFDIKHRQLRQDKFELDVLIKTGILRLSTLQEEQLLLVECEQVEQGIQSRIDGSWDHKSELDKNTKALQSQVTKMTREIEEYGKKEKALFAQVETAIGDTNPFHDFLVKVYKKRVKRKPLQEARDNDSDSSESESESSDDDEGSDDDDDDVHLDLSMCPKNCSEQIYNEMIALRENRLDLDEAIAELKKAREALTKDIDTLVKKRQGIDASLSKSQKELSAFQRQKQQRLNALTVVVTINLHQVQCLSGGELNNVTTELILSEEELIRLQNRIGELHEEKKEERRKTIERRRLHALLKHDRKQFIQKLEDMDEVCKKEMVKKFGRLVDLEVVETVVADPQKEDVRFRLLKAQRQSDNENRAHEHDMSLTKRLNVHSVRLDSEYRFLEADMKLRRGSLSRSLDIHQTAVRSGVSDVADPEGAPLPKDIQDLMDLVAKQRRRIQNYLLEIQYLQGSKVPIKVDSRKAEP